MKKNEAKTTDDLLRELVEIRQRIAVLEAIEGERKRAEEALRESQERYRMLAENSAVGIWHISVDGYTIYLNPAMCAMLEIREPEEVAGRTYHSFFTHTSLDRIADEHAKHRLGIASVYEVEIEGKHGGRCNVVVSGAPLFSADGKLKSIIATFIDITKRKEAEEALRESEEHYRAVVENVADAIVINVETRRVFVNKAFLELHGLSSPVQVLGTSLDQFIVPGDRQLVTERTLARQQGRPAPSVYEYRITRLDGEVRTVQTSSVPISYHGQTATLAVLRDVTELKRAEAELQRLSRQSELILTSAGEGIYGLDAEGNATFVNPAAARMIGWEIEELIGRPMHAILHHSQPDGTPCPEAACPIFAALKDGAVHRMDTEVFWRKDGTSFPVEYISTPIREHGELVGVVVTFKDITVERQTERLAMLGRVAAGVAHELNNALSVVLACAQLLLKRTDPQSDAYHDLGLIEKYADTCGRIAQDLRRLGRPLPLKRELVELHPLIEETLKPLDLNLASRKVHVKVILDPHLPPLSADPRLLGQALLNLITNAAEAMPEGGVLTVNARLRQKDSVEIAVSDTGVGIAREHLSRIFEPFFTIKSSGEGMGLGLTITSRIVQDHEGSLEVKSEVGRGSTFRILLPLLEIPKSTSQPLDG